MSFPQTLALTAFSIPNLTSYFTSSSMRSSFRCFTFSLSRHLTRPFLKGYVLAIEEKEAADWIEGCSVMSK